MPGPILRVPARGATHGTSNQLLSLVPVLGLLLVAGCSGREASPPAQAASVGEAEEAAAEVAPGSGPDLDAAVERIRAATERFKDLDSAVAAGYSESGGGCVDNPPVGAMGYHHMNDGLMDDRLEVERPEILVFASTADGAYEMTGVEYIVPFDAWSPDREPPTILGRELKPSEGLGLWYLHVWVWRANDNGLFADWNPSVQCPN